jgi:hypothetical protein
VIWTFYDQVVKAEKGGGGARVCASLQDCQVKQGCQMSKYPIGYNIDKSAASFCHPGLSAIKQFEDLLCI